MTNFSDKILAGGPVQSSHIKEVLWTDEGLVIIFNDMSMYLYPNVSELEFRRLYGSRSAGSYFASNIRNEYRYIKLE